jgi:hypothetical protein
VKVDLRPHQRKAVEELDNGKILYGGVGVGKSITALAYYYEKECKGELDHIPSMRDPKKLVIITTAKKRDDKDWQLDAAKLGISSENSLDGVEFVVDSWNNIAKYEGEKDAFFIFDEQRLVGSGAWTKAFIKIAKSCRWILLSATPGDTWLDYIPVFVANGFYKNRTEFKRRHVVYNTFSKFPKVDRYVETGRLVRLRNQLLVHMPYERHTVRNTRYVPVSHNKALLKRVTVDRWHVYEERPIRDVAELFAVMRKVVNSDSSRLAAVRTRIQDTPRLIVFYNFDYELEMLRELQWEIRDGEVRRVPNLRVAEWNGHKHQAVPETDRWVYLVQYAAGAEGWNCVRTDSMLFWSLTYSYKHFHQAHGRIDRLNTPYTDLWYDILISDSAIDKAVNRSLKAKRSFNEASEGPNLLKNP